MDPSTVIETDQRLSQSLLWTKQRAYFLRQGVAAWRQGAVPHFATNHALLAQSYAEVIVGFLRDVGASGSDPVSILELGAGSGRFAYLLLRALQEYDAILDRGSYRYIATDLAPANVDFWKSHPSFAEFRQRNLLDFAVFDLEHGVEIVPDKGGPLSAQNPATRMIVIANYVFDSIPQDAFSIKNGTLHELLISIYSEDSNSAGDALDGLRYNFSEREIQAGNYAEPGFNHLLNAQAELVCDGTFLFPYAALRCIDRITAMSTGSILLLIADFSGEQDAFLRPSGSALINVHGSISLPLDSRPIHHYFRCRGGEVLPSRALPLHLNVQALLGGSGANAFAEVRTAYSRAIQHRGPEGFFLLRRAMQGLLNRLPEDALTALVQLSGYDPQTLCYCVPALTRLAPALDAQRKERLCSVVKRTWRNYYCIQEPEDLALEFGLLCYNLGDHAAALALFRESPAFQGLSAPDVWDQVRQYLGQSEEQPHSSTGAA